MNTVNLVGRLTRDPDAKTTNSGLALSRFSVAVDRPFKDKQTGEYGADFPNCVAFDKTAEFINKYFSKGQRIGITGRLQTGKYEHQDGHTVYTTDVVVERAEFVESKGAVTRTEPVDTSNFDSPSDNTALPFDL